MLIYVAHRLGSMEDIERAKKITHDLQVGDVDNTYLCPSLFLAVGDEIGEGERDEICLDVLSVCDKMIATSGGVEKELEFAELVGMEVEFIENA